MAVKLVKKTEQKTEETKKGTGRISLVPNGKEVTAPETFSTKPVEKKQEERPNVNTAQERSGMSRDEFDSSVRSGYAQRLQQEQERMAAQQKQEEVRGGSFGGGAAKESDRGGFTGNRVEGVAWNDQPSRAGNVIVGAGKDYMGSMLSALGAMAQTAGDRNQANRAAQMLEEIYAPGTAPELVKQSAEKEKTTWDKVADMGNKLREEGKQLSAEGQAQTQQQKQGLGTLGQFAVDAGAGGVQMATDIGIGWLTGVGMTIPMAIRSLGAGVEKAKADGADLAGQLRYGLGTAAAAYGMEKLFGIAFAGLKVANPGIADDFVMEAINKLAAKLANTPQGATAIKAIASLGASFGGEFAEEFLEAFVEPYIRRASYDPDAKSVFQDPSLLADYLYEGLIGGSLGLLGGSVNVAINTKVESGTDEDLKKAYRQYQSYFTEETVNEAYESLKANGMFSTKAAQDVQKANRRLEQILPEQSKPLTAQQRADQAAYIEAAGLVDRAEDEIEAAEAIFPTGNEMTRQEGAQPETRSEPGGNKANANTAGQQKENAVDLSQYPALQKFVETGEMESPAAVLTEAVNAANDGVLRYEDSEAIAQQTMAEEARINSAAQAQPAAAVMEGANENGAELRVSGERGRGTGESAGRQSGTVPESAGGRQNRSVQNIRGRDRADAVAWEYEKAHADPISTRDLFGTDKGSEDAVLRVASSRVVQSDEELRSIDREIREAGYTPYFFTGMASITSGQQAPAYVRGKNVYIRIDHPKWTAAELWAHEKYHTMAAQNPGMVQQQWNELCRTKDGAALREMLKTYRDRYHGAYDIDENGNAVWNEQVMWKIVEEILADSYAGRDTYGTGVNAMTGDVRQMSQQRAGGERQTRGPPEGAFAFAGEKSATADLDALARAKEMDGQDVSAETIRQETGWFKGMDGKWRYEIDDSKMRYERRGDLGFRKRHEGYNRYRELTRKAENFMLGQSNEWLTMEEQRELTELQSTWGNTFRTDGRVAPDALPTTKLTDYIDHPELFEAYPELRDASLVFAEMPEGTRGQYDRENNIIRVSRDLRHAPQETLLHEIQHAVQQIEGFAGGASVEYWSEPKMGAIKPDDKKEIAKAEKEVERWEKEFEKEWGEDSVNLDLARKYVELTDQWGELGDQENILAEMESIEEAVEAAGWDDLLAGYMEARAKLSLAKSAALRNRFDAVTAYRNTAGEIEARDTGKRRELTADERKKTAPDLGGEDTVFADESARFALDDEGKENNYAGHEVREETREEFLRRTSKGNGRIIEEGGISYGYVPVRDGSARPAAKETQRELNKLGIDCFVHDGVLEGNVDGKTYRAGDEATTVGKTRVGISNNIDLDPANTAGHEAFHMWVKSPDGADYVETLADNIDFASDAFRNLCTKIENEYYKNGVTLKNKTDAKRLLEEVFAYVTGDIHAGTTDTNPEELLRDYGAVKSAWKWLVSKKAPESGGSFALDGSDEAYMEAVERGDTETVQRMVDKAAREAGYDSPKLYHGTKSFGFTEFDLDMMDDGISIFTAVDPEMAASYARGAGRREIVEGAAEYPLARMADTELLNYAKAFFQNQNVELVSDSLRNFAIEENSEYLTRLARRIEENIDDLAWSFNAEKEAVAGNIVNSVYQMANAETLAEVETAIKSYKESTRALERLDVSVYDQFRRHLPYGIVETAELKKLLLGDDVLYVDSDLNTFATAAEIREEGKAQWGKPGVYTMYGKTDDLLEVDAEGRYWNDIPVNGTETQTTREIARDAKDYGWSGVLIRNVMDYGNGKGKPGDIYIYFGESQLKSADPVTYDNNGNVIPLSERFNEEERDFRFALDGETDERPWWEGEDEEIRSAAEMMAERNKRDPAFDIDEYLSRKMQEAEAERADRLRNIPKSEFKGTQAMEKLGIKVEGSVTRYDNADQMRKRHAAAQSVKRELRKAEKRLGATAQEKMFAGAIASGTITEDMIPQGVNRSTVMELADYYMAERAQGVDMIRQRRVDINRTLDERMGNLLKGLDKFKVSDLIVLNNRTPQRNMLKIFGGELGKRINEEIFDPVAINEAERIRFVNREYDKVRTFRDSKGKESKLTKEERALVQMVIEGRAVEEIVAGMEISNAIKYAAENIVNGKDPADAARQYSLDGKEQELAVKYARWLQAQEALRSGKVDNVKVENAANTYSKLFDQYYDAINDFLVVHGYEPIGFIKGYAPHLQPKDNNNLLQEALKAMGLERDQVSYLPTEIAGKTADFRPNKRWNPYFLQRTGDQTDYDIATAFESYVDHLSDVLYHTDDIMRVRRMERFFRKAYSKEDRRSEIEWAEGLRDLKPEERLDALKDAGKVSKTASLSPEDTGAKIDEIIEDNYNKMDDLTKYGEFVMWLSNYANILAGKQAMQDRGEEYGAGRPVLNLGPKLSKIFGRATIAGNLSSALNQVGQLPMILSENGSINTMRAAADIMSGNLKKAGFAQESDVLTGKGGINFLVMEPSEMLLDTIGTPAEFMDKLTATLAVRGAYHKAIRSGMNHEEAMKAADRYGRNVMGSREKGVKPLGFHSKKWYSALLHTFQLEVLNNWEHVTQDMPQDIRKIEAEKGKAAAAAAMAGVIVKTLLTTFLLNRLTEEAYGGTPAPFDIAGMTANFFASGVGLSTNELLATVLDNAIEQLTGERPFDTEEPEEDEEFDAQAAFADLWYNMSNEIPFFSNVSSLMGWGDQTLPWPDVVDTGSELLESIKEDGLVSDRTAQAAVDVAGEILPGGRQLVKSYEGIQSAIRGGKMTGYGEDKTLQFPTEQTPGSIARQVLFGVNATPEARSYWASGDSKLSAKQTQLWQRLVDGGADSQDVYDVIQSWRNVDGDKELDSQTRGKLQRNMIRNMDMTDEQKFDMYKTLTGADSRADKFKAMMRAGMSWDEVMDAYEKHQELENNSVMKSSEQAAAFVKWAYSNLSQKEANAAVEQLAFWTTMKAKPSQATLEEQLNKTKLTNNQRTAIWNSYGWKAESPWK